MIDARGVRKNHFLRALWKEVKKELIVEAVGTLIDRIEVDPDRR